MLDEVLEIQGWLPYPMGVLEVEGKVTLSAQIDPPDGGTIEPGPVTYHDEGVTAEITAKPASGYSFIGWDGDASGSSATLQVIMDGAKNVRARFSKQGGGGDLGDFFD